MSKRAFKGLCGVFGFLAGGGALVRAVVTFSPTGDVLTPTFLFFTFVFAGIGGIWLFMEALTDQKL